MNDKRGKNGRKGQFYLIAAIVIITVMLGLVGVTNYVKTKNKPESIKLYELNKELKLEGESVINYGIFNKKDLNLLLENFTKNYGDYIAGGNSDVYFIYGDENNIKVYGYTAYESGSVGLDVGGQNFNIQIQGAIVDSESYEVKKGDNVAVNINNTAYSFRVQEGQNFYFVIKQPK